MTKYIIISKTKPSLILMRKYFSTVDYLFSNTFFSNYHPDNESLLKPLRKKLYISDILDVSEFFITIQEKIRSSTQDHRLWSCAMVSFKDDLNEITFRLNGGYDIFPAGKVSQIFIIKLDKFLELLVAFDKYNHQLSVIMQNCLILNNKRDTLLLKITCNRSKIEAIQSAIDTIKQYCPGTEGSIPDLLEAKENIDLENKTLSNEISTLNDEYKVNQLAEQEFHKSKEGWPLREFNQLS